MIMSCLGLDIGTTGAKAIVFDDVGRILSQAYRDYPLIHPKPEWAELDANALWATTKAVIRQTASELKHDPIRAIGVCSQGEAVVPLNKKGHVLYNFTVSFDNRTIPQLDWWKENVGADYVFKVTGMPLHSMYSINKVMWFAENMPEVHNNVWKYLCVEDFIIYRLCGETAIDYSLAARTMAFDVTARRWSNDMLSKAGLDDSLLSSPCASGTQVGTVTGGLADELALQSKVAVVAGGHDQACAALGAGIIHQGMSMNSIGTVDVLCPALPRCILNSSMLENNYCCYPHAYPGVYISVAFNLTGGLLLRWYVDVLCEHETQQAAKRGIDPYSFIIDQASTEPANVFILPHFVGAGTPALDPQSKGAFVGLTVSTTKSDLTRAVLDSINYEMKYNVECMKNSNIAIDELRAIGGGAKSAKWLQMRADVFGTRVSALKVTEAGALGAAMLAAKAIKQFSSLDEAIANMVKVETEYWPNSNEQEKYQSHYDAYRQIYPSLRKLNHRMSRHSGGT